MYNASASFYLFNALPDHLTGLGMVGCNLNDQSEKVITSSLSRSNRLRLTCVEENDFSAKAKGAIRDATKHLSGCATIVQCIDFAEFAFILSTPED